MEKITAFLDGFDLAAVVPELTPFLEKLHGGARLVVMIGPAALLLLGLIYLLIPPKEANHHVGFRTYFGMGSVEAWRFTQRLAGIVLGGLGLILGIIMWLISGKFSGMELQPLFDKVVRCLLWQIGLVLVAYIGLSITAAIFFDRRGNRRWNKQKS